MTTEQWGTFLVWACAPSANLFSVLYFLTADWRGTWAGRAVMISKFGLATLVDAALLYRIHGSEYPGRPQITLIAFGLITVGTYLYLFAFAREQYLARKPPRSRVAHDARIRPADHPDRPRGRR